MSSGLPLLNLPDFEELVLDRLVLCCAEITGINKILRTPPSYAIDLGSFPVVYPLVGAMQNAIPADTAGSITVVRDYIIRLLGDPLPQTLDNTATSGAQAFIDLVPFFARFRSYFINHPQLQTTTLGGLDYMYKNLAYIDGGYVQVAAPGGVNHLGIDFGLQIEMRARVTRTS